MKQLATEKINPARAHLNLAFILLLSVFLGACGGGGGGGSSAPASPTTVSVTGTASKGALFNATITAFPLNSDGSRGATPIATTTTDATGNYQLTLNPSQFVVLVVTGGSYVDEATMTTLSLAPGEEFEAYAQVPANGQIRVNITPLTSMAAAQARSHIANDGQTLAAAVANANAEISATFDVGDVLTTNLPSLVSLGSASVQEINYVLLLAGFSQMDSNDGGQSAVDIVDAVAADVNTDGLWGNAGTETPQTLLAATNQFLAVNAGTISQSLSSTATNSLSQPILDVEAGGDNTNDTPVASDDAVTLNEGTTANIDLAANDFDPENALDLASIVITTAPANGSITVNANGTVDYTHDGSETTNDTFSYTIADLGGLVTAAANVSVTVTPVNDIPVAADDAATLNEGAGTTIDLGANDSDGDDGLDLTSITIIAAPANGTIDAINNDGTVDYTHNGGETVSDSFTYTIDDLAGASSNVATVAITVNPVNDTPVATDDAATLNEARTLTIDLGANDTDADDGLDLTSIAIVSAPVNGTIDAINADGTVDYTHDGSSTTSDSFTYTIDDNSGAGSNTATVNLTVLQDFNEALYATPVVSSASDSGGANVRQFQANDGLTLDSANGWVVNNAAPGPHTLTLNFTSAKLIHSVALSDLVDLVNNVTSATLTFSNGDTPIAVGALPTDGTEQKIIFPAPKLLSSITVTLDTADTTAFGLSEFKAFSSLEAGQKAEEVELFNDGDAAVDTRWTVVDDCDKGTSSWSAATNNEYRQTGDCRGFTATEGVEIGTYQVLTDGFLVKDMDLRLRLKSSDNAGTWQNGAIGIFFAHRAPGSNNDYYRLDISHAEGHVKLWKKVGGAFTELNTSPQSLTPGDWVNLRVVRQNGVIVVYLDDVKVMAVEDNETALNNANYRVALFCARNESCAFDNLAVLSPPSDPIVGATIVDAVDHASGEYYVDSAGSIDLNAVVTDDTNVTEVEFIVDEGQAGEVSVIDADGAPYTATFGLLAEGEHTVRTYLRDGAGRLSNEGAVDELPQVGISGIHLVGLGDSITLGLKDDNAADDVSTDTRNTSGGYQSVLNNLLTAANSTPVTVLNEGNAGETSAEGAARIDAVLARTPTAQAYLMIYGANDSSGGVPTPSGETLSCTDTVNFIGCDAGYLGSFKHNIQIMINAMNAAGKVAVLSKAPPHLSNASRNTLIQGYNNVIDELIAENGFGYTPADFHTYFTNNSGTEMADDLHPNGAGYVRMADGWCKHLSGISLPDKGVITCTEATAFPN